MTDKSSRRIKKITIGLPLGQTYHGEHLNMIPNGRGMVIYANGDKFEGRFKLGRKHGKGMLFRADGEIYEGVWRNDQLNGRVLITLESQLSMIWDAEYKDNIELKRVKRKMSSEISSEMAAKVRKTVTISRELKEMAKWVQSNDCSAGPSIRFFGDKLREKSKERYVKASATEIINFIDKQNDIFHPEKSSSHKQKSSKTSRIDRKSQKKSTREGVSKRSRSKERMNIEEKENINTKNTKDSCRKEEAKAGGVSYISIKACREEGGSQELSHNNMIEAGLFSQGKELGQEVTRNKSALTELNFNQKANSINRYGLRKRKVKSKPESIISGKNEGCKNTSSNGNNNAPGGGQVPTIESNQARKPLTDSIPASSSLLDQSIVRTTMKSKNTINNFSAQLNGKHNQGVYKDSSQNGIFPPKALTYGSPPSKSPEMRETNSQEQYHPINSHIVKKSSQLTDESVDVAQPCLSAAKSGNSCQLMPRICPEGQDSLLQRSDCETSKEGHNLEHPHSSHQSEIHKPELDMMNSELEDKHSQKSHYDLARTPHGSSVKKRSFLERGAEDRDRANQPDFEADFRVKLPSENNDDETAESRTYSTRKFNTLKSNFNLMIPSASYVKDLVENTSEAPEVIPESQFSNFGYTQDQMAATQRNKKQLRKPRRFMENRENIDPRKTIETTPNYDYDSQTRPSTRAYIKETQGSRTGVMDFHPDNYYQNHLKGGNTRRELDSRYKSSKKRKLSKRKKRRRRSSRKRRVSFGEDSEQQRQNYLETADQAEYYNVGPALPPQSGHAKRKMNQGGAEYWGDLVRMSEAMRNPSPVPNRQRAYDRGSFQKKDRIMNNEHGQNFGSFSGESDDLVDAVVVYTLGNKLSEKEKTIGLQKNGRIEHIKVMKTREGESAQGHHREVIKIKRRTTDDENYEYCDEMKYESRYVVIDMRPEKAL